MTPRNLCTTRPYLDGLDGCVLVEVEVERGQRGTLAGGHVADHNRLRLLRYAERDVQEVQQDPCKTCSQGLKARGLACP